MGDFPRRPEELTRGWVLRALGRDAAPPGAPFGWKRIGAEVGLASTLVRVSIGTETAIVKWPSVVDGATETAFLRDIAPSIAGLPVAALRFSEVDASAGAAVLVLEDIAPARNGDCLNGATPDEAGRVLEAVAPLHAAWWGRADATAASAFHLWTRTPELDIERARVRGPICLERYGHLVPPGVRALIEDLPKRLPQSIAALSGRPLTLVHDDLHFDNVLFRPDGAAVILDWSDVRRGPCVIDFARVLVEAMLPAARREHGRAVGARYIAALRRAGVRDYGEEDLARDTTHAHVVLLGAAVRWAGGPDDPRSAALLVPAIVENIVRNLCSALDGRV